MKRYDGKYAALTQKEQQSEWSKNDKKHTTSPKGYTSVTVGGTPTDAATQEASPEAVILT